MEVNTDTSIVPPETGEERKPLFVVQNVTSRLLEKFGSFIRPVATRQAAVLGDVQSAKDLFGAELPFKLEILPRVVTSKLDTDDVKFISFKTPVAGRADYLLPVFLD